MLDPNLLRTEPDAVAEKLARRGFKLDVEKLRALEERRKVLQVNTENLQAERNSRSKSIGQAKARGEDIEPLRLEVNKLGEELDAAKAELETLLAEIRDIALTIPNLPDDSVPVGRDENDNVEVSRWGTPRQFDFEIRYLPDADVQGVIDDAQAYAQQQLLPLMQKVAAESAIHFEPISAYPGLLTDPQSQFAQWLAQWSGSDNFSTVAFGTEGGLYDEAGIATLICGPGSMAQGHKPDEFIAIEQLEKCQQMLANLCQWMRG